jgi:hypothetical protein
VIMDDHHCLRAEQSDRQDGGQPGYLLAGTIEHAFEVSISKGLGRSSVLHLYCGFYPDRRLYWPSGKLMGQKTVEQLE